ncbi:TonB-dependent receptor [Horticoccus luteus]|uniref:TonB-dependent receptor n=1 Tax=Horticoccus luteus TaxID=2862869 RepID=A0A8F9XK15_9BACT|nr:TonB-dependent receptor [Horticoccus luteus]QYM79238.1 TonB-dependent receptor [Horticoccus luteus]
MRASPSALRQCFLALLAGGVWLGLSPHASAEVPQLIANLNVRTLKSLTLEQLMDVEVTSVSRYPEKLTEASSAVQVLTGDEIRHSAATTIPEALRLASNLNVAQKNAHDWGISARGFNTDLSNKLLVLIDGRAVYTPLFAGVRWDAQDTLLEDVDRIEVVSGPGGTLWGSNAVNGVINITTKSAAETQGLYLEALTGWRFGQGAAVRYGGTWSPTTSYRVYAKYTDREGDIFANGTTVPDGWEHTQAGFRIDADPGNDAHVTFQGDLYTGTEGFVTGRASEINGGNVLGRWSRTLSNGSTMQLQAYFDHTHFRQPVFSPFAPTGFFSDDLDTSDLDFQHDFKLAETHHIVWGLGYRHMQDASIAAPGLAFAPANLIQDLFSAFAQDEIALSPRVSVTVGTKVEHTDYSGFELEPTLRFQWKPAPDNLLWAAVSRSVRTPSRIDRDLRQPASGSVLRGSDNFQSENLVAYEAGYRTQFNERIFASLALFYNRYDDIRSANVTASTFLPLYFANDLEGHTYGLELTATGQAASWWRLTAGYNLLREHLRVSDGGFDFNVARNETSDPAHQASLRSSMDLPHALTLDGQLRWVDTLQSHNGPRPDTVPAYTELDLRLAWAFTPSCELSLVGRNLLHDQHPEFGITDPMRVELQRTVYAKIALRY